MKKAQWENWSNLLVGVWLFLTPWLLSTSDLSPSVVSNMSWNAWIVGALVFGTAFLALRELKAWEEWTNLVFGVWMIMSPWMFGYSWLPEQMWNSVAVGSIIAVLSLLALPTALRLQHQHS